MYEQTEEVRNIKTILERLSGVQNIGLRRRKRFFTDLKKTYYKLCSEFTDCTLELMSEVLGFYDHSTAIHNIKEFNNLYGNKSFTCNTIYDDAKTILKEQYKTDFIKTLKQEEILEAIQFHENKIQELINLIEVN